MPPENESTVNPFGAAAASLAVSAINQGIAEARTSRQRKWSAEQAEIARNWQLQMWNRQNEYDLPQNKVARLHQAGLNPLMFNPDGSMAATPTSVTPAETPSALGTQGVGNPVESYLEAEARNAQIENIKADTRKKLADAEGQEIQNLNAQELIDLDKQERDARISKFFSEIDENDANAALARMNTNVAEVEKRYKETLNAISELDLKYREPFLQATIAKTEAETKWLEYKQDLEDARLMLDNLNSEKEREVAQARINLLEKQEKIAAEDARVAGDMVDAKLKEMQGNATYAKNKTVLSYINETVKGVATVAAGLKFFGNSAAAKGSSLALKEASNLRRVKRRLR